MECLSEMRTLEARDTNKATRAGRVAQAGDYLPSKYKALSSNLSTTKRKKKKKGW
jgi:hypothetical protein